MIIGLTGPMGSGKSEVIKLFLKKGFKSYSLTDIIKNSLNKKNITINRENLIKEGNLLRREYGSEILAKDLFNKIKEEYDNWYNQKIIIDSIKTVGEVNFFKKINEFFLIGIKAKQEIRFKRIKKLGKYNDDLSFEKFLKLDNLEKKGDDKEQNVEECLKLSDFIIENDNDLDTLIEKCNEVYSEIRRKYTIKFRQDWDTYFLKLTMLVAERSTCIRRHVGAIAVKDRQILSTGYNGAPTKTKDCLELGCLRDQLKIPSGEHQEICRAVHAEQNAIIQAANHGVKLDNATLYCTHSPCYICAKMIVNAKFKRVVVLNDYPDKRSLELFKEAGIKYEIKEIPEQKIRYWF